MPSVNRHILGNLDCSARSQMCSYGPRPVGVPTSVAFYEALLVFVLESELIPIS